MTLPVYKLTSHTEIKARQSPHTCCLKSAKKNPIQTIISSFIKYTFTILSLSSLQAFAQSDPAASPEQQEDVELIEVFAQKRAQNSQDVPISITRFSSTFFEALEIKDTTQLSAQAANVKITQNAGEGSPPSVNIRGIGLIDYNTSNTSPVAFYVDDVVSGSANNQIVNLFDMESIEILRGPQGTLFGRNTTGGAILFSSKMPEQNVTGYLKAGYGDESHLHVEGAINIPFSDNTLSRLAVAHHDYEYSTNNLDITAPEAGLRQTNARYILTSTISDVDLQFKAHIEDWSGITVPYGNIGVIDPATGGLCTPEQANAGMCTDAFGFNDGSNNFHDVSVNNDSPHDTESSGLSLKLSWDVSENSYITSITAKNSLDRLHKIHCDASPLQLCEATFQLDNDVFTQELRWQGEQDNWYWILGGFYLDEDIGQDNDNDILRGFRGILDASLTAHFFWQNDINTKSKAIFSQADYAVNDKTTVSFGLRYTKEDTTYHSRSRLNVVADPTDLNGIFVPNWDINGKLSDDNISGRLAINHKYSDSTSAYYSFSRGFKSGGYNGATLATVEEAQNADFGAEIVHTHEIGSKHTFARNKGSINGSLFYYDYQDQQVFMNIPSSIPGFPPQQLMENVASSTIYGAELELNYRPVKGIEMFFGLGYLPEANYNEFVDPIGNILTNNRLPFTSEINLNGMIQYTVDMEQAQFISQLDFDHQSKFYYDQTENPYVMQDGYSVWNARFTWQHNTAPWQASLWVKNLFDEEYHHLKFNLIDFLGMVNTTLGNGRGYGASVKYQF